MDILWELLFEIIAEIIMNCVTHPKLPKWLRYSLFLIIALFFISFFTFLFYLGFSAMKNNFWGGIFIVIVTLFLLYMGIRRCKQEYLRIKRNI